MKICHKCKKEIADIFFVGRQAQCPSCGADLHCCLNCFFAVGDILDKGR
jgi:rRNA maturation endonuclease Nob1